MKKLTALLAVFLCFNIVPVHAATPKVMVIIDSGVDTSHPAIRSNIIYEACFALNASCPNKQTSMEGVGAATVTADMATNTLWQHGTKVASAATQTDPNIKIIEIRCAQLVGTNGFIACTNDMLSNALNWVYLNKDKFNIGVVVSPLAKSLPIGGKVALGCDSSGSYVNNLNKVLSANIAVIFPTGNDFNYANVSTPACLPGVLAISAVDDKNKLALYANYSSRVDFAALGNLTVAVPGGAYKQDSGTSLSVAVFGADWLKIFNQKNLSFADEYNLIKNTSLTVTNVDVKKNVLAINIVKALQ